MAACRFDLAIKRYACTAPQLNTARANLASGLWFAATRPQTFLRLFLTPAATSVALVNPTDTAREKILTLFGRTLDPKIVILAGVDSHYFHPTNPIRSPKSSFGGLFDGALTASVKSFSALCPFCAVTRT